MAAAAAGAGAACGPLPQIPTMEENPPDPPITTGTEAASASAGDGGERGEAAAAAAEEARAGGEKEEEEAFLVSLYQFMKERRTPIERIPHLGFKQINLWKIYKAVEKLGAYELVTGRRLWKNVYDELGGSPGSTSAATCTRRHYERLVLPYVRHLKGEDDKPLPPSKPRKQYKVSKGAETGEKSKRARRERGREQVPPEQVKPEDGRDAPEWGQVAEGCSSPGVPRPSPSVGGCLSPRRPHAETYKRLFSSFFPKGTHPIMSPLAKKKLLAQVTKAEAGYCHQHPWPEGRRPASHGGPSAEPTGPTASLHCLCERRSPEPPGAPDPAPSTGSEVGPAASGSGRCQPCPRAEEGAPAPTVFTGCFHAYRSEGLKPAGCHPLWGYFSSLKDCLEPSNTFPAQPDEPERPQDLQGKAGRQWSGERRPAAVQGCWVPPGATFAPKRGREEETAFGPGAKLRALSPFVVEADGRDAGTGLPGGLAKPKAVVASPGYASPLPPAPDGYKGATLHFPASFGNPLEHLKSQGVPVAPALSVNPFVVPAFPSPLVASAQPSELGRPLATGPGRYPASYESSLRHRLYPAAAWHSPPPYSSLHPTAFHRHAKL